MNLAEARIAFLHVLQRRAAREMLDHVVTIVSVLKGRRVPTKVMVRQVDRLLRVGLRILEDRAAKKGTSELDTKVPKT